MRVSLQEKIVRAGSAFDLAAGAGKRLAQ